jgi:hypothetical protein
VQPFEEERFETLFGFAFLVATNQFGNILTDTASETSDRYRITFQKGLSAKVRHLLA